RRRRRRRARRLAVHEYGERVARIDLRAREPRGRRAMPGVARSEQLGQVLVDELRGHPIRAERRVAEEVLEEREVGRHAVHPELRERAVRLADDCRELAALATTFASSESKLGLGR